MSFAEFISVTFPNASTELKPIPGAKADPDFIERYSRGLDDYDFNYTLIPCKSLSRARSRAQFLSLELSSKPCHEPHGETRLRFPRRPARHLERHQMRDCLEL